MLSVVTENTWDPVDQLLPYMDICAIIRSNAVVTENTVRSRVLCVFTT